MANWITIPFPDPTKDFSATIAEGEFIIRKNWNDIGGNYGGKTWVIMQYDEDSITTTSIKVRWGVDCPNKDSNNYYYLLINPTDEDARLLYKLKAVWTAGSTAAYPYYGAEFELTKSADSDYFKIPPMWFLNDGMNALDNYYGSPTKKSADFAYKLYGTGYRDSDGDWHQRLSFKVLQEENTTSLVASKIAGVVTRVGVPTITVVDNYNNTFTVTVTSGNSGSNNEVTSISDLTYTYTDKAEKVTAYESGKPIALEAVNRTAAATYGRTRKISVSATATGKYNDTASNTVTAEIRQCIGPDFVSDLRLLYDKSRLTLKENWTLKWKAPQIYLDCPIKGYRIRLYRKRDNNIATLPIYGKSGKVLSKSKDLNGTSDSYYDRDACKPLTPKESESSVTIYPEYYIESGEIKVGDYISFAVTAYTKYGEEHASDKPEDQLFLASESFYVNNNLIANEATGALGYETDGSKRGWIEVRNAGIVHIKVDSRWKEGQVYIKANGSWKEAETVYVKDAGDWKESQ